MRIRDHLSARSEDEADRIHRQYLVNEFRKGDDHLRLLPTQADRDAYRALILHTPGARATGAVGDAYRFFLTAVTSIDEPDDGQAVRLKDAVDLDAVQADLAGAVQQALEPAHLSVWISHRD